MDELFNPRSDGNKRSSILSTDHTSYKSSARDDGIQRSKGTDRMHGMAHTWKMWSGTQAHPENTCQPVFLGAGYVSDLCRSTHDRTCTCSVSPTFWSYRYSKVVNTEDKVLKSRTR